MNPEPRRRFRAAPVVGLPEKPEPRAREADGPAKKGRWPKHLEERLTPRLTRQAALGAVLLALALACLILFLYGPLLRTDGESVDRDGARDGVLSRTVPYLDRIATMPIAGLGLASASAVGLVLLDVVALSRGLRALSGIGLGLLGALGGFLTLLSGSRLFGLYVAELLRPGDAAYHAHVGAYALVLTGGVLFVGFWKAATPAFESLTAWMKVKATRDDARRWCPRAILVLVATFAAMPLLPLASDFGEGFHLSEGDLFQAEDEAFGFTEGLGDSVGALKAVHVFLWVSIGSLTVAWVGYALGASGLLLRVARQIVHIQVLAGLSWIVLVVLTILLYTSHLPRVSLGPFGGLDYGPALNWFLPLGLLAAAFPIAEPIRRVSLPFLRTLGLPPQDDG